MHFASTAAIVTGGASGLGEATARHFAAKVAIVTLLARDLAQTGIRVMAIVPGIFKTPMLEGLPDDVQATLAADVPNPSRLDDPSEYGGLAGFSVENENWNSEVIRIDGALRMRKR